MNSLSPAEKRHFRALLFKHQDGLAICNTIAVFEKHGIFAFFQEHSEVLFDELHNAFPRLNAAYLNVAIRSLASQGLFHYEVIDAEIRLKVLDKFKLLRKYLRYYVQFSAVYRVQLSLLEQKQAEPFILDQTLVLLAQDYSKIKTQYREDPYFNDEVAIHLEGVLLLPVLVFLRRK